MSGYLRLSLLYTQKLIFKVLFVNLSKIDQIEREATIIPILERRSGKTLIDIPDFFWNFILRSSFDY